MKLYTYNKWNLWKKTKIKIFIPFNIGYVKDTVQNPARHTYEIVIMNFAAGITFGKDKKPNQRAFK